jgi:photosystem II stability/assembly factor-like uncharacterized protein
VKTEIIKKMVGIAIALQICCSMEKVVDTKPLMISTPQTLTINSFAVSDSSIWASTDRSTLFSSNNGESWKTVDSGPLNNGFNCFVMLDKSVFFGTSLGVFRSTDQGAHWSETNPPLTDSVISLIEKDSTIFAATKSNGVFALANAGKNWISVDSGLPSKPVSWLSVCNGELFAGFPDYKIYHSVNSGKSWSAFDPDRYFISFSVIGNIIFAGKLPGDLLRSTDNGASWTDVTFGCTSTRSITGKGDSLFFLGNETHLCNMDRANRNTPEKRIIARSTDGGMTWEKIHSSADTSYIYALVMNGATLLAGIEGSRIIRSTDNGETWLKN